MRASWDEVCTAITSIYSTDMAWFDLQQEALLINLGWTVEEVDEGRRAEWLEAINDLEF